MFELSPVIVPELFVALSAMALLIGGVFRKEGTSAAFVFQAAICVVLLAIWELWQISPEKEIALHGLFVSDAFAIFAKMVILIAAGLVLVMSLAYAREGKVEKLRFEYPVLILLSVVGMMVMVSANDIMSLYMGLELQSLALYVLASIERDSAKGGEAGLKYFMLGALSSGILLYGASLVYGFAGTTSFTGLAALYPLAKPVAAVSPGVTLGMVLVIIGLCFKISAAPFHMWAPDVYEGAPKPVTAFFASSPKVAALALFARVLVQPFGGLAPEWRQVIIIAAILSMAVGAFGALRQSNIKRLMAYSSIAHMGFVLVGLAAATQEAVHALLVYAAIYIVMSVGAFGCILLMRRNKEHVEMISDLSGLSKTHPGIALTLAILMLSMAGIPPLAGFFGKLFVFQAAIRAGMTGLAVLGVLLSVVGAYYYLKIVKVMYFDSLSDVAKQRPLDKEIAPSMRAVLLVTALFNLLFCVFPAPLLDAAKAAASSLFAQ